MVDDPLAIAERKAMLYARFRELMFQLRAIADALAKTGDLTLQEAIGRVSRDGSVNEVSPTIREQRQRFPRRNSLFSAAEKVILKRPGVTVPEIVAELENNGYPLPERGAADRVRSTLWGKAKLGLVINNRGKYYPPKASGQMEAS